MRSWLVLGCLLFAGCNLYFGDDDDQPPPCGSGYADDVYDPGFRNPQTGECEYGWGGGCDYGCGCPADVKNTPAILPDWASCGGQCDWLDEQSCLATPGCRAEYTGFECPPNADCAQLWSGITFWSCSAVAPSGPKEGGDCWSYDAQTCSEHDDCATTYQIPVDPQGQHSFNQCIPEPGTIGDVCAGVDCGPGAHCEQQCYPCDKANPNDGCMSSCSAVCVPDQDSCANVDCGPGYHCEETCKTCGDPNTPCPDYCTVSCVPDTSDPGDCYGTVTCNSAPPACPADTTPGVANGCYTGYCIPISECKHDPGTCDGPVVCGQPPPACPAGTEPGVANGCWSGYCIPDWACWQSCESITDEKSCLSRADCNTVYTGTDCTCDQNGCVCKTETFSRCETNGISPPPY
ncbi:MAG TPA: hypothetical protein VL463_19270 [Kofleriaceae bacterium]|nr:hypothetical protein [Kofleriaceae bacterium]